MAMRRWNQERACFTGTAELVAVKSSGRTILLLNLGSGQRKFGEGWTNIDISPKFSPDIVADCSCLPMFANNSVDLIVCHHTLEHYGCGEADGLIKECLRLLEPRGSLLVFVPDMQKLVRMWIEGQMSDQLFFTNTYGAYHGEEPDRHRWGFTERSLKDMLYSYGFRVMDFDWRKIPGADIARDDRWILGVEAVK
jgi:predicted SAM-dependent methyltransferase